MLDVGPLANVSPSSKDRAKIDDQLCLSWPSLVLRAYRFITLVLLHYLREGGGMMRLGQPLGPTRDRCSTLDRGILRKIVAWSSPWSSGSSRKDSRQRWRFPPANDPQEYRVSWQSLIEKSTSPSNCGYLSQGFTSGWLACERMDWPAMIIDERRLISVSLDISPSVELLPLISRGRHCHRHCSLGRDKSYGSPSGRSPVMAHHLGS